jgi:8-oxo-dGTP diphosphatase
MKMLMSDQLPIKLFAAVKAFIVRDGKVLVIRESSAYRDGTQAGKYDVVGGRIEPGQAFDESLSREVKEETGLDIAIGPPFFVNESRPVVRGEPWHIIRIFFVARRKTATSSSAAIMTTFFGLIPRSIKIIRSSIISIRRLKRFWVKIPNLKFQIPNKLQIPNIQMLQRKPFEKLVFGIYLEFGI